MKRMKGFTYFLWEDNNFNNKISLDFQTMRISYLIISYDLYFNNAAKNVYPVEITSVVSEFIYSFHFKIKW